jgi:hypothetical protein
MANQQGTVTGVKRGGLNSTHNLRVTRPDCHCGCRYCGDLDDLSGVQIVRAHSKYSVGILPRDRAHSAPREGRAR